MTSVRHQIQNMMPHKPKADGQQNEWQRFPIFKSPNKTSGNTAVNQNSKIPQKQHNDHQWTMYQVHFRTYIGFKIQKEHNRSFPPSVRNRSKTWPNPLLFTLHFWYAWKNKCDIAWQYKHSITHGNLDISHLTITTCIDVHSFTVWRNTVDGSQWQYKSCPKPRTVLQI